MASLMCRGWHVAVKAGLLVTSQKPHIASRLADGKAIPDIPKRPLYQASKWLEVLLNKLSDDHHEALSKCQAFKLLPLLSVRMDWSLIGALAERWNPLTHTFHFQFGETTVLLEEVSAILGIRSPSHLTCGRNGRVALLSIAPKVEDILSCLFDGCILGFMYQGQVRLEKVAMGCLNRCYHTDPAKKEKFLACVFMCLMGVTLFYTEDLTLDAPHATLLYEWCSLQFSSLVHPVLAFLYHGLNSAATGGEFFGSPFLLQTWAYVHFSFTSYALDFPPSHDLACGAVLLAGYERRAMKRTDWRSLLEQCTYEMFDIIPTWIFPSSPYVPLVPVCDLFLVGSGHFIVYLPHCCIGWIQGSIFPPELSHVMRIEERMLGMSSDLQKIKDIVIFYECLTKFALMTSKNGEENMKLAAWYPRVWSIVTSTVAFPDVRTDEPMLPHSLRSSCTSSLVQRAFLEADHAHSSSFDFSRNSRKRRAKGRGSSLSPTF